MALDESNLYDAVRELDDDVRRAGAERYCDWLPKIARDSFRSSAENLAAYLAFREHDLRALQDRLTPLGLSSLGRCESHVMPALAAVRATLAALCGIEDAGVARPSGEDFAAGDRLLQGNADEVFGTTNGLHVMVTLSTEAANSYDFVKKLVLAGMDSARINCAHDSAEVWRAMADNVRRAADETRQPCKVYMDVAGPKLRIGEVIAEHPKRRFFAGDTVQVTCTEPAVHDQLLPGMPAWIDDGKIGAVVVSSGSDGIVIEIQHASAKGNHIRPGKGLNFPQTTIPLPALGVSDLADLDEIVANADIVGQSFVKNAADVELLLAEFERRGVSLPVIAKIETADAIANLPDILVAGAGRVPFGIMIARGDLAIEIGYQRLAEIQEELLWICQAAHVPVVWATQVLDGFVRTGIPTRAEMTDAAMSERAECVMLNKGPFVVEAVAVLGDVVARMRGHQTKKSARLRALHAWQRPG